MKQLTKADIEKVKEIFAEADARRAEMANQIPAVWDGQTEYVTFTSDGGSGDNVAIGAVLDSFARLHGNKYKVAVVGKDSSIWLNHPHVSVFPRAWGRVVSNMGNEQEQANVKRIHLADAMCAHIGKALGIP